MKYVVRRILALIITMIMVSFLAFAAFHIISGDPARAILGMNATEKQLAILRQEMGLDKPFLVQYINWLFGFFTGNLGVSYSYRQPVAALIMPKLKVTLLMVLISFVIIIICSLPLGLRAAQKSGGRLDWLRTTIVQLCMAVPAFFLSILVSYIFGIIFKFFTPGDFPKIEKDLAGAVRYLFFAAVCIAIPRIAMAVRMLKSTIIEEMEKDYVRTAISRGNDRAEVLKKHVLKNSLVPTQRLSGRGGAGRHPRLLGHSLGNTGGSDQSKDRPASQTGRARMKKHKWNGYLIAGVIITTIIVLWILIGRFYTPYPPTKMSAAKLQGPSLAHLFGTDKFGRDIFSRVMQGSGTTLFIAALTIVIGAGIGTIVGAMTGYFGGIVDEVLMRLNDALTAFPSILLALVIRIVFIPSYARMMRTAFASQREVNYIISARLMGASSPRILMMHMLPNTMHVLLPALTIGFNNAVLAEASMSFLGIGVTPPDVSMGYMLSEAQGMFRSAPWYALSVGGVIALLVFGISLIGEGMQKMNKEVD